MYIDKSLLFTATAMDLSASSTSVIYSDSALDLGSTVDIGRGRTVYLVIVMVTALASSGSTGTVVFALIDEEDETLDTNSVEIIQTDPLIVARLTEGKVIVLPIPSNLITQQFIGVRATIGGETTTAGTCTAFLALEAQAN